MMLRVLAILFLLLSLLPAQATDTGSIIATCGFPTQTYTAGQQGIITLDTSGKICINVGTVTVTGTVSATQGTSPWVVSGTVAVTQSTSPWVVSVPTWAGGTLGAMANYGTSPGAVLTPGVNAFVTNIIPVTGTFWQATQPVSGTFWQATQPVSGTFWQATQPVSGTFWQATQPVSGTVTANAGTNLNTSALALESGGNLATLAGGIIAQEATTSGVKGLTAFGAVTTNAPSYTTLKSDALSLDTSGLLRVSLKDTPANTNKLLVTPDSVALPANQSVNVAQINGHTTLEGGTNGSQAVGGTVATNVAITANPLNLGAQAVSSENTAVTTARQVQLVADLVGKLIVLPYANPENFVSGVTAAMTGTTSTSLIAAPASGLRNYLTQLTCTNSHATVGTFVLVQDGSAGTTIYEAYAVAVGGGFAITFPTPLRQPTTATAIYVQDVTTGANVICSGSGYKGA